MADTKTNNAKEEMVAITLPIIPDPKASQQEFYSYNFKNYLIKRGIEIRVPKGLKEIIDNQEKAKLEAIRYAKEKALQDPMLQRLNRF